MSDEDVPFLSSDDNESDEEPSKHEELLSKITKLGKRRKLEQREEPSLVVSEFHLSNSKDNQVDTESLLAALSNKKGVHHLKTRLNKVENKTAHLLKPLSSIKKDKLQRKVAFEEAKVKVSKWESIVKHNRKAEHLKFPLQTEIPPRPSLSSKVESFEPRTPMELEIAAVLRDSQHNLLNDQELTESEKKELLKLSLEEAKERRAELRKMRTLISAYEQKQRRINRIKSKKFHKVQRKIKAKIQDKEIGEEVASDDERIIKAEKLRAKPRTPMELEIAAVLRDSQHNLLNDQELTESEKKELLKLSLEEAKERRAELRKMRTLISAYEQKQRRINRIKSKKFHKVQRKIKAKIQDKEIGEEVASDDERIIKAEKLRAKERATLKHSRMSKWAKDQLVRKHRDPTIRNALTEQSMLKKELKQKQRIEESSSDEGSVVTESEGEEDLNPDPSNQWLLRSGSNTKSLKSKRTAGKQQTNKETPSETECTDEDNGSNGQTLLEHASLSNKMSASKRTQSLHGVIDTQNYMKSGDDGKRSKLAQASENLLAVQEAFAGDDVIGEFLQDKQEEIEEDKPKIIDTSLPGWGSWAGLGVAEKKKKQQLEKKMEVDKDEDNDRMDSHLKYVIINHKRDKKIVKHMVSKLPYPLTDGIQFKKMMAAPIGRHWNTETRFTDIIRPKVEVSIGSMIQPMRMTDEVQKFMHKTSKDKRRKAPGQNKLMTK